MTKIDSMIDILKPEVSERRFIHSINTMETAKSLAKRLGADVGKCEIAGLLHDCAKNITGNRAIEMCERYGVTLDYVLRHQTSLLHGYLGRIVAAEKFGIDDEEILGAIEYHTMGKPAMNLIEKIIFLSDYIEPHRFFAGVEELRIIAYKKPDYAVVEAIDGTIRKILSKGEMIHLRILETRNYYISIQEGDMNGI